MIDRNACSQLFIDKDEYIVVRKPLLRLLKNLDYAVAVTEIDSWCVQAERHSGKYRDHYFEGRWWTYNSYDDWNKDLFDYLSLRTVKTMFGTLRDNGIIFQRKIYDLKQRKTLSWYSVNYEMLALMTDLDITLPDIKNEFPMIDGEEISDRVGRITRTLVQKLHSAECKKCTDLIYSNNNINNTSTVFLKQENQNKIKGSFSDKEEDFGRTVERSETECGAERSPLSVSETEGAKATIPVKGEDKKSKGCSVKNVSTKDLFMPEVLRRCLTTSADYTEHVVKRIIEISELYNSYYNGLTGKYLICVPQKVEDVAQKMTTPVSESSGVSLVDLDLETVDLMIQKHIGTNYAWGNDYNIFLFLEPENLKNRYYEVTT